MSTNDYERRSRLRGEAKDSFLIAAAALTQIPTDENIALATLHGAIGLMKLAESDKEEKALKLVMQCLKDAKAKVLKETM